MFVCTHCSRKKTDSKKSMFQHLRDKHGIDDATEDDYNEYRLCNNCNCGTRYDNYF